MGFEKIEAKSLTDLFVQKIEGMILSGELKVGDQLPPVRELCTLMGVSRPVVTAGLIELEKMGFVEVRSRQGVYITDYRRKGTLETFNVLMRYNGGIMRDEEVRSVIEMRLANEVLCVRLVIERATPEELDSLAPMIDAIRTAASNEAAAEATYELLHEECVLSGNVFLPLFLNSMRSHCLYFCTLYCKRYGIGSLYQNRLKLYQAMLNRDVKSAIEIARGVLDDAVSGEHQLYGKPQRDSLVEEVDSDKEFWDYVHEINIGEFNGIELGEYGDIFASFADDPENPAIPLIRYMIALTRCPLDQVEDLLNMARGKYVNELDIPASDVEEDFEEEYEEKDE